MNDKPNIPAHIAHGLADAARRLVAADESRDFGVAADAMESIRVWIKCLDGPAEPTPQKQGELTKIIIGAVVGADRYLGHSYGMTAADLARLMCKWNVPITENHARTRLNQLANEGRINRVARGRFIAY